MDAYIYNQNLQALRQTGHIELVNQLESVELNENEEFLVSKGSTGTYVLKVKNSSGRYISWNSAYNPFKEAKEITSHLDYEVNRSIFAVIGVGMGYHLLEMVKYTNEKSVIFAIEENVKILKNLLYYVDFSKEIRDRKIVFVCGKYEENSPLLRQLSNWMKLYLFNILSIQAVVLPVKDLLYIRYCKNVLKYMDDLRDTIRFTMGNDLDDTIIGIENNIQNLPHVIKNPGFKQLLEKYKSIYKGKPAIIIASGPSLDKNIHLLKEAEGKALLLACDGSMESLKKHNIIPDAVGSVERIMLTYEAFYKDKEFPDDTVLVAPAVVRPEIFKTFKTKTLGLFKNEPIGQYFNKMALDKGVVFSGASVAHQLMGIAVALEADPIILVGQDLAYSKEGVSHVNEAAVKEKVDVSKVNLYVKDIYGDEIPTTFVWKQFKQIYEEFIRAMNINVIDATEGGAYIEGTKIMTLREVIDTYCTESLPKFRGLVDSLPVDDEYITKAYRNSLKLLIKLAKKYYLLYEKCNKAKKLNEQAQKLLSRGIDTDEELDQVYDALDYTEYKIVKYIKRHPELVMFFQYPIMVAVSKVNELGTEITFDVLEKNLNIHVELMDTIQLYSQRVISVLKEGFFYIKNNAIADIKDEDRWMFESIHFPAYLEKFGGNYDN